MGDVCVVFYFCDESAFLLFDAEEDDGFEFFVVCYFFVIDVEFYVAFLVGWVVGEEQGPRPAHFDGKLHFKI